MTRGPLFGSDGVGVRIRKAASNPWVFDGLVVLVNGILAALEPMDGVPYYRRPIDVALTSVAVAALWFRRRFPMAVLAVAASTIVVANTFFDGDSGTADRVLLIAIYSVSAYRSFRWVPVAIAAQILAYLPLVSVPNTCDIPCQIARTPVFAAAAAAGVAVRRARLLRDQLENQTGVLRRTREERIRLAVIEERARVARDLHDGVAHDVTTMVVHAGAARALATSHPDRAREALEAVRLMGNEALEELGSLMGSLEAERREGSADEPIADDDRRDVASLVERVVAAGLRAELGVRGDPRPLGAALELSVYRIVQEALTNARKHAPGARVWVEIVYGAGGVDIVVTDSGSGAPTTLAVAGAGQGLIGIGERAALFGGHADSGLMPQGGFRVHARLQLDEVAV